MGKLAQFKEAKLKHDWGYFIKSACLLTWVLSSASVTIAQKDARTPEKPRIFREEVEWLDIWMPDPNVTNLPRVLLIGDSITRAYNKAVQEGLKEKAVVFRLATSKCAGDPVLPEELLLVLRQYRFDVIHFNNGSHGQDYDEKTYGGGLREMIAILRKYSPKAHLVWAFTAPIRVPGHLDQLDPTNEIVIRRNAIATTIMKQAAIPTDDLYALVLNHPDYYLPDGAHFNENGVATEASQVVRHILEVLPK